MSGNYFERIETIAFVKWHGVFFRIDHDTDTSRSLGHFVSNSERGT